MISVLCVESILGSFCMSVSTSRRQFLMGLGLGASAIFAGLPKCLAQPAVEAAQKSIPLRLLNPNTREAYDLELFIGDQWNPVALQWCHWLMRRLAPADRCRMRSPPLCRLVRPPALLLRERADHHQFRLPHPENPGGAARGGIWSGGEQLASASQGRRFHPSRREHAQCGSRHLGSQTRRRRAITRT